MSEAHREKILDDMVEQNHEHVHDLEGGSRTNLSDSEVSDNSESDSDSEVEFEEIDLTDNPLYQVLSTLFEDEEGNNLCTILKSLVVSVDSNTKAIHKLLKKRSN